MMKRLAGFAMAAGIALPALAQGGGQVLKIGAGTSVITPFLDGPMAGYYYPRQADGVHDHLHAKALVFDDGGTRIVLVATDTVSVSAKAVEEARALLVKRLGIPASHVLISATHSHTGPQFTPDYEKSLARWIADAAVSANGRAQPARLRVGIEQEPSLPHYRRYRMKDGTVQTNPGFLNPGVVEPAGAIDPQVGVLYADDEFGKPLVTWVNYAMHLDTVGGTWISADYPYFLARLLQSVKGPDMLTVFTIGAAGNINHWDVRRPGPQRGLDEAQRLGEVLGAAVLKAYTHLERIERPRVAALSGTVQLPAWKSTAEEVEEARKIVAKPPTPGVDFTLDRVKAERVLDVHNRGGRDYPAEIQVICVGPVAFAGIPGELFVELGRKIRQESPFPYTFVVSLANDDLGYIVTRESFEQGSYEPTSSRMAPGHGEMVAGKAIELLRELKKKTER
jgi:hypothetical protein